MSFLRTYYSTGTISVNNAGTTVTGVGTAWTSAGMQAGDYLFANGLMMPIAAVVSNTSITLEAGWPGSNIAAGNYFIVPAADGVRIVVAAREVLAQLQSGNVAAIAGLTSAANKAPYFTGAGAAGIYDQTTFGRAIQGLTGVNGGFIRATGAGAAAMQAIVGTVTQAGGVPTGSIIERGANANGDYVRFADGTQICSHAFPAVTVNVSGGAGLFVSTDQTWTFPAVFFSPPVISVHTRRTSSGTAAPWVGGAIPITTNTTGSWRLFGTASNIEGSSDMMAIGRWF